MRDEDEHHREAESSGDRSQHRYRTFLERITREVRRRGLPSYRPREESLEPGDDAVAADEIPLPPE